jgi:hypothetical protein
MLMNDLAVQPSRLDETELQPVAGYRVEDLRCLQLLRSLFALEFLLVLHLILPVQPLRNSFRHNKIPRRYENSFQSIFRAARASSTGPKKLLRKNFCAAHRRK